MQRQRNPHSPRIVSVRSLAREDLAQLQVKTAPVTLARIRDSHHMIARLIASGLKVVEVARRTGYSATRISTLTGNPAMQELITKYRDEVTAAWRDSSDEYFEYIYSNGLKAQRKIAEALDDSDEDGAEPIPINRLLAIAADSADRVGYTKKTTNVNINVDFAAKLEAARARSARVIDNES